MQGQERDLIEGLFTRLKTYEAQPRDPEADGLIGSLVAGQPGAPYLLTQTVLVQEQALKAAQERIAELEAKANAAPSAGFLSSAPRIGPWGAAGGVAPGPAAPPAASTRSPLQAALSPQSPAGGGFLRSALATAAGVAGGALLFDGIRGLFGHSVGPLGGSTGLLNDPLNTAGNTAGHDPVSTPVNDPANSPLMPPDHLSSADLAQDDGSADNYDASSDDMGSNDSGFDTSDV